MSKNLAKYIPDGTTKQWETNWHDLSVSVAGNFERGIQGDLMGTYREIEKIIDGDIRDYEVVLDLSMGPPNIALAFSLLAMKYSISAIYVNRQDGENIVTSVLPRG